MPVSHTVASEERAQQPSPKDTRRGLTDCVRLFATNPQLRVSIRRLRTPAFPFGRTGEILRKVTGQRAAVERPGIFSIPALALMSVAKSLEKARRNRRRPSSMAEHWFCNFPGGAHTDSRECGRFLEMTGRQARPRHPQTPGFVFRGSWPARSGLHAVPVRHRPSSSSAGLGVPSRSKSAAGPIPLTRKLSG